MLFRFFDSLDLRFLQHVVLYVVMVIFKLLRNSLIFRPQEHRQHLQVTHPALLIWLRKNLPLPTAWYTVFLPELALDNQSFRVGLLQF